MGFKNKAISITIVYLLNAILCIEAVRSCCMVIGLSDSVTNSILALVRNGGYFIADCIAIRYSFDRVRKHEIFIIIFIAVEFLVATLLHPDAMSHYFGILLIFLSRCFPVLLLAKNVQDNEKLISMMKPFIIIGLIYGSMRFFNLTTSSSDYMVFSYALLLPIVTCLYYASKGKYLYMFVAAYLSLIVLVNGARGAFLCSIVCLVVLVPFVWRTLRFRNKIFFIGLILIAIILVANIDNIFLALAQRFPESRSLYVFNSFALSEQFNGRQGVYSGTFYLLNKYMFSGTGLFTDRLMLSKQVGYSTIVDGVYEHNIFLELLLQFGCVIGGAFILFIIGFSIKKIRIGLKHREHTIIFIVLVVVSTFVKLCLSSSYIEDTAFWFVLGLFCSKFFRERKNGHVFS